MRALAEHYRAQLEKYAAEGPPRVVLAAGDAREAMLGAKLDSLAVAARNQPADTVLARVRSLAQFRIWFEEKTGKSWDEVAASYRDGAAQLAAAAPAAPDASPLRQALDRMLARSPPPERETAARSLLASVDGFDLSVHAYLRMLFDLRERIQRAFAPVAALVRRVEALGPDNWPAGAALELQQRDFVEVCAALEAMHQSGINELTTTVQAAHAELELQHVALKEQVDALRELLDDEVVAEADGYVEQGQRTIDESQDLLEKIAKVSESVGWLALAFAINPLLGVAALIALLVFGDLGGDGDGDGEGEGEGGAAGTGPEQSGQDARGSGEPASGPPADGQLAGLPAGSSLPKAPEGSQAGGVGSARPSPDGPWFTTWLEQEEFGISVSSRGILAGFQLVLAPDGGDGDNNLRWVLSRFHEASRGAIPQILIESLQLTDEIWPVTVTFSGINRGGQLLSITWKTRESYELGQLVRD